MIPVWSWEKRIVSSTIDWNYLVGIICDFFFIIFTNFVGFVALRKWNVKPLQNLRKASQSWILSIYSNSTSHHYSHYFNHRGMLSSQNLHRKMTKTMGTCATCLIHRPDPNSQASGPSHRKFCLCNTSFGGHLWSTQINKTNWK